MSAVKTTTNRIRRTALLATIALAACTLAAALASPAQGAFGFESFEANLEGPQASQAGGHADFVTDFTLNNHPSAPSPTPDADLKTFLAELPPGFLGNPNAMPQCSNLEFAEGVELKRFDEADGGCKGSTQLGVAHVVLGPNGSTGEAPIYNLEAGPSQPARFGFAVPGTGIAVIIGTRVRTDGDYGATAVADGIIHTYAVLSTKVTFWADPGNPSHDPQRFPQMIGDGTVVCGFPCAPFWHEFFGGPPLMKNNPGLPPRPFLSNPTRCEGSFDVDATVFAYGFPDEPDFASDAIAGPEGMTECDLVPFEPGLAVAVRSTTPDSPTGIDVETTMPPSDNLETREQSHMRKAVITMPEGVAINAGAANVLEVCSDEQLNMDSLGPAECPPRSRVGQVEIYSPSLVGDGRLTGYVAQRPQTASEPYRLAIVAEGHGVNAKIPGVVRPDPNTGQITTIFDQTPQLPFSKLIVRMDGGEKALLATPTNCGTHVVQGTFTPWSGTPDVSVPSPFEISGNCASPRPFGPGFAAGSANPRAGAHTSFTMRITRPDGDQELSSLSFALPKGLTGKLAGIPYCPEAAIASFPATPVAGTGQAEIDNSACPAASQIGTTTVGAGAGASPYYTHAKIYLAGPYKGAPLSVVAVVPAVAGPFDLGVVAVRTALHIDPRTAQVSAITDPLPRILGGIPLRIRDVQVRFERPGFMLNPTDCRELAVAGTAHGSEGAASTLAERFQVGDCRALGFKPRLRLHLLGGIKRGSYQGIKATLTARRGDANIAGASVKMPPWAFLAQEHLNNICTRVQFAADACPKGSVYGKVRAISPLVDRPLTGKVYLRSSDNPLPDLVALLKGPAHQPIEIELAGKTDSVRGALRTTFSLVPDAPVTKFSLRLFGGKKGLIVSSAENLCRAARRATVRMRAQNGRRVTLRPKVTSRGCGKARKARKRR